jgi:hypothetical protein
MPISPLSGGSIEIAVKAAVTASYRLTSKGNLPDGLWRLRHNTAFVIRARI